MTPVLQIRVNCPAALSEQAQRLLAESPAISSLAVISGASVQPPGDVIVADVAREAANDVVRRLHDLGVHREGVIELLPVRTWISQRAFQVEESEPGASSDAIVWSDVVQRAYDESAFTWTFASFMVLATMLAGIAIVLDSQILVIGAMVLGPEFGAIAALGIALIRRRPHLLSRGLRSLALGFSLGIGITALATLAARSIGWVTLADITGSRPGTQFIYTPDKWSFIVALLAGAAGVLAMTSERGGTLIGVFISVTTIPAAGNVGVALAFGEWSEVTGSGLQLAVNITGMAVAGWATLILQSIVWSRVARRDGRQTAR